MSNQLSRTVRVLFILGTAAFLASFAAAQVDLCNRDSKKFDIKIKVKDNTPTEVEKDDQNADDLHVCRGDTIKWKLRNNKFFITFPDKTPADSHVKISKFGNITMVVSDTAERGVSYKYDIGLDGGGTLDPRLIVD